jgi:glycosyltransferase involved in cell wall biosynthesis
MSTPFFSIVTPTLNCAAFLPRNFASIASQGLPLDEIEHWVIDGGSTDGTQKLLSQKADIKYISEKDDGLSDAVNKGIRRAAGEWIIWLNADDELAPGALIAFKEAVKTNPGIFMFCGRQDVFRYDGSLEATSEGWDYNLKDLLGRRTAILQASTFVHRKVYEKVGLLDVNFRYAMDYEWMVRAAHQFSCQPLAVVLTRYHRRKGSIMDAHIADQFREFLRVRRHYRQSYFSPAEWRIRFYLLTNPLRRIGKLRKGVRQIKKSFGREPIHPMS